MIRAIAIDDEPSALEVMKIHCEDLKNIVLVQCFSDVLEAIDFLTKEKIDLIFLDINMPKVNGMAFLKSFRDKQQVIITSAYSEYALESYEYEVSDYLIKPIRLDRLIKAVQRVERNIGHHSKSYTINRNEEQNELYLKSGHETHKVCIADILYLESDGNYVNYYTTKGEKIMVRSSMNCAMEQLNNSDFIQIHKRYIIAKSHMTSFQKYEVKVNEAKLPIGSSFRLAFEKEMSKIIG